MQGKNGGLWRQYASAISFGMDFAVGMALFTALGWYIGRRNGAADTGTLCGMFVGLLYGAYEVWRIMRQIEPPGSKPGPKEPKA